MTSSTEVVRPETTRSCAHSIETETEKESSVVVASDHPRSHRAAPNGANRRTLAAVSRSLRSLSSTSPISPKGMRRRSLSLSIGTSVTTAMAISDATSTPFASAASLGWVTDEIVLTRIE